jgi:agmatine deiminase
MPAEWEPHDRCFLAWPGHEVSPPDLVPQAKQSWAKVARTIAAFEPVVMVARPGFGNEAASHCDDRVEVIELPFDEVWLRDYGPIFVVRDSRDVVAVDFLFNVWGARRRPFDQATTIGAYLSEWLGLARCKAPFVLEGGAITVDGEGTMIAIEASILDESRNPGIGRREVEEAFTRYLGIDRTIWLQHGLVEDDRMKGHVDNVARFVGPARVLCQTVRERDDPNYARLGANRAALERASDARGRSLEIIDLDILPYAENGDRFAISHVNFYIGNNCVIVPVAGRSTDRDALALLQDVFPDREVVGIPWATLARCRGGIHCITQQQPLVVRAAAVDGY